jgi:toxin FitB
MAAAREDYLVLDTDVASQLQRQRELPACYVEAFEKRILCVTFITVGELWQWAYHRRWTEPRREALRAWLRERVLVIPYDSDIAHTWGRIRGSLMQSSTVLPQNDAWIAACCVRHEIPLATLNHEDYLPIDELELLPPSNSR